MLIAAQDRIIIGEPASQVELDLEQFAPQKDRLSEGTAVPVRLLDAWKTKLQLLKPDWERASVGSAVGNLTGVAQIVVSAPPLCRTISFSDFPTSECCSASRAGEG